VHKLQSCKIIVASVMIFVSRAAVAVDAAPTSGPPPAPPVVQSAGGDASIERLVGFWKAEAGAGLLSGNIWGMRVGALRFVGISDLQIGPSISYGSSSTAPKLNSDGYDVADSSTSYMELGVQVRFPVIMPWLIASGGLMERIFHINYKVESENDSAVTTMNAASLGIKGGVGSAWDVMPGIQVGIDWVSFMYPFYVVDDVATVSATGSLERVSELLEDEAQNETDKLARGMNTQIAVAYASYEF